MDCVRLRLRLIICGTNILLLESDVMYTIDHASDGKEERGEKNKMSAIMYEMMGYQNEHSMCCRVV